MAPDFIAMLGLQQALTPSRNNGFLNMFKLMQARMRRWLVQQEQLHAGLASPLQLRRLACVLSRYDGGLPHPPTADLSVDPQKKALDIYMQQAGGSDDETPSSSNSSATAAAAGSAADGAAAANGSDSEGDGSSGTSNTPVADSIRRKLREELQPLRLEIVDNSHQHAGHAGEGLLWLFSR